jgi:hypothetical protein
MIGLTITDLEGFCHVPFGVPITWAFAWRGSGKSRNTVTRATVSAKIRTKHLSNTDVERYPPARWNDSLISITVYFTFNGVQRVCRSRTAHSISISHHPPPPPKETTDRVD